MCVNIQFVIVLCQIITFFTHFHNYNDDITRYVNVTLRYSHCITLGILDNWAVTDASL